MALGAVLTPPAITSEDDSVADQIKILMIRLEALEKQVKEQGIQSESVAAELKDAREKAELLTTNNIYGYEILDPTTRINRKQQYILETRKKGEELDAGTVTLSGSI